MTTSVAPNPWRELFNAAKALLLHFNCAAKQRHCEKMIDAFDRLDRVVNRIDSAQECPFAYAVETEDGVSLFTGDEEDYAKEVAEEFKGKLISLWRIPNA